MCFGPFETTVRSAIRIPAIVRTDKSNCIQRIVKLAANLTHARSHLRIFVSISFCGSLFKFTSIGILSLGLLKRVVRVNTETMVNIRLTLSGMMLESKKNAQLAEQVVKITRLMSIFTSKKVWKF